jgi:hypothetical protein
LLYPQCFDRWAPPTSRWSAWAKPVLFATGRPSRTAGPATTPPPLADAKTLPAPDKAGRTALILDLPATQCVAYALAAARRGYQPVPLFNTTPGVPNPALNLQPLVDALATASDQLATIAIPADAPPAFMLDTHRLGKGRYATPRPGDYDNRWILFPQDVPSGRLLRAHGITRAVVVQADQRAPLYDLIYLLRAWHRDGLAVDVLCLNGTQLTIRLKSGLFERIGAWFELLFTDLHRNSAGGFGSRVPFPSSGG